MLLNLKTKAFTLIELLAVIVILAIILVIAIPQVLRAIDNTRQNAVKIDARGLQRELEKKRVFEDIDLGSITVEDLKKYGIRDEYTSVMAFLVDNKVQVMLRKDNHRFSTYDFKVYGVSWAGGNNAMVRTDDAVGMTYTVGSSTITSDFDTADIYKDITEVTDTYGNKFMSIPKFYIKKTVNGNAWTWQISNIKVDEDYYLPACFYDFDNNKELPYVLVGKYNASLNGTKLESKSGLLPQVNTNITTFRNYARNNNVGGIMGYQLLDIHVIDVLQTLFVIEFATLDSQSVMGGYTNGSTSPYEIASVSGNTITLYSGATVYRVGQTIGIGLWVGDTSIASHLEITNISGQTLTYSGTPQGTIAVGHVTTNVETKSGKTDGVATPSGSPVDNSLGKYPMKYRGIENLYGNVLQIVDGINTSINQSYVAKNANNYETDKFDGEYKPLGYMNLGVNNYVLRMGYDNYHPFANFPVEAGLSLYGDLYYQSNYSGGRVALFGGGSSSWTLHGLFFWSFSNPSSDAHKAIGSRLVKKAL